MRGDAGYEYFDQALEDTLLGLIFSYQFSFSISLQLRFRFSKHGSFFATKCNFITVKTKARMSYGCEISSHTH